MGLTGFESQPHGSSPKQSFGWVRVPAHRFKSQYVVNGFTTQGLNPGLPHCRQILYQLNYQGSPRILEWVAYSFSNGSSQPRNWTRSPALQVDSLPAELPGKFLKKKKNPTKPYKQSHLSQTSAKDGNLSFTYNIIIGSLATVNRSHRLSAELSGWVMQPVLPSFQQSWMLWWGGGTYLLQRNHMPVGQIPTPLISLLREAPRHSVHLQPRPRPRIFFSFQVSLPPAARCDGHSHQLVLTPLPFVLCQPWL